MRKTSAIQLFNYVKMKSLSHLSLLGKIRLLFAVFGVFLPRNGAWSQVKGVVESKFDKYFIHTILGKKILVQIFSGFAAIDDKGHFRKILTRIFKFGRFSWYHSYIV